MNVMAIAPGPKQIFCFDSACGEADPDMEVAMPRGATSRRPALESKRDGPAFA
jgi:hypothetical protein